jgi:hypothetical protein
MKEPKPTEAMDIEQESATTCKSLSLMDEEAMLYRKSPPCHQTMDLSDRESHNMMETGNQWKWHKPTESLPALMRWL